MAMHLFCLDLAHAAFTGQDPKPGIMVIVYDANGEAHGRSDEGFGWALKIKGAVDDTRTMTYAEANRGQGMAITNLLLYRTDYVKDNLRAAMGLTNSWMSAPTIPELNEDLIFRAWKWFNTLVEKDPRQSAGAFVLIEMMQPVHSPAADSPPSLDPSECYLPPLIFRPPSHPRPHQQTPPGRAPRTDTSSSSGQAPFPALRIRTHCPSKRLQTRPLKSALRTPRPITCRVSWSPLTTSRR